MCCVTEAAALRRERLEKIPATQHRSFKSQAACLGAAPSRYTIAPRRWLGHRRPNICQKSVQQEGKRNTLHLANSNKTKSIAVFIFPSSLPENTRRFLVGRRKSSSHTRESVCRWFSFPGPSSPATSKIISGLPPGTGERLLLADLLVDMVIT